VRAGQIYSEKAAARAGDGGKRVRVFSTDGLLGDDTAAPVYFNYFNLAYANSITSS